jgi:hypothetical protein
VHATAPKDDWYVPAAQAVQLAAPPVAYLPAAHATHGLARKLPVESEYFPAAHATHEVDPVAGW